MRYEFSTTDMSSYKKVMKINKKKKENYLEYALFVVGSQSVIEDKIMEIMYLFIDVMWWDRIILLVQLQFLFLLGQ